LQTSTRPREPGASFAARRAHIPQLSISDDNHHVTEAIGYMYEDEDNYNGRRQSKPSSNYSNSPGHDTISSPTAFPARRQLPPNSVSRRPVPARKPSTEHTISPVNGQRTPSIGKGNSWDRQNGSGTPATASRQRAPSDTATSAFPLNDIDYESSPAAVAQELSNLQALRRMSMDVAAAGDPDLPSLSPAGMPGMAPSASDSEDDSSRLFWVPARLHPELAPQEFRTFLESKAEQIRRRSGELSSFSSQSSLSSSLDSGVGLRRKKSMLSRQIDNSNGRAAEGYQDGADRLERKRSLSKTSSPIDQNLEELESLVNDSGLLKRLSFEGQAEQGDGTIGDIILPTVPGSSLKRSTRTTYRRPGSTKANNERLPYSKRLGRGGSAAAAGSPTLPDVPPVPSIVLEDAATPAQPVNVPSSDSAKMSTNFSRPAGRTPSPPISATTFDSMTAQTSAANQSNSHSSLHERQLQTHMIGHDRPRPSLPPTRQKVPQIIETPPPEPPSSHSHPTSVAPPTTIASTSVTVSSQSRLPERTSSREDPKAAAAPQRAPLPLKQNTPIVVQRPTSRGTGMPPQGSHNLDHMSSQPSPLPGMDTSTSNLSFIPTLTEDKKADNKKIKDKKEEPRKSSWGWLLGKEEGEKDKRTDGLSSKPKAKIPKPPEKHDNTRLDLLQTSIDGAGKGRESIVLDRESLKLEEERKKESQRKSAGSDMKKEKDGLFSSIFGGKKNKSEKENSSKKHSNRGLSPEPPYRELKPDIDYNWTRFSILEERAIYRMAHIKLANPRRALYSQVLLSNFMYSYLAKVQQMHPQMNLPTSAKQQQKQQKQQQQQQQQQQQPVQQQPDEYTQYQRYQQVRSLCEIFVSSSTH
jgi:hypothetical protein